MQTLKEKIVGAYEALRKGVFIIASTLIIFIAFRNSLTWHLEEFWGTSKSLWSTIWATTYWGLGENSFNMFVFGSQAVSTIPFVFSNILFAYADITGKPEWLTRYKMQQDKNVPVNWEKYKKCLRRVIFNATVVGFIFNLSWFPLFYWRGNPYGYELPTFTTTIWHLFMFIVVEEIWFYYCHRLFHHPRLYKYIHKTHHEWTAPVGIASIYCHPVEHYISNLAPIAFGPLIMGSHISVAWLWYTLAILNTTSAHGGYHLPFMPSPEYHDFHHLKFNQNFGVMGILDRLHGTDDLFRLSKNYERHIVMLGLTPARELFPDPPKGKTCCN